MRKDASPGPSVLTQTFKSPEPLRKSRNRATPTQSALKLESDYLGKKTNKESRTSISTFGK